MQKIKIREISLFLISFYQGAFDQQRLGQAFVNTFRLTEPIDVFYEVNDNKATEIIFTNYVDLTS